MSAADHAVREPAPWQGLRERQDAGQIPFQSCATCGHAIFYPRVLCPDCGSTELEWRAASGAGTVYSQTFLPARDGGGRQIVLVDMAEGFRLMGVGDGERLAIGDGVRSRVVADPESPDADPAYVFTREDVS